jgi:hypothetical protein
MRYRRPIMTEVTIAPTPSHDRNNFVSVNSASVKGTEKTVKTSNGTRIFKLGKEAYLKLNTRSGGLDSLII